MSCFGGFGQSSFAIDTPIEKCTPWVAASDGSLELVQSALTALNMPPTIADENGYTLVHAAAAYSQQHILEWLMKQEGVDVNAQDNDGDTPLHHAENVNMAKFLIEKMKANPSIVNSEEKTAFQVRQDELQDQMEDEDEDDDDDLKELVEYLRTATENRLDAQ
jgi:ankyrin repeat protein